MVRRQPAEAVPEEEYPWRASCTSRATPRTPTIMETTSSTEKTQALKDFITEIAEDLKDLHNFYNVSLSKTRIQRIGEYLVQKRNALMLEFAPFEELEQAAKVDWVLTNTFLKKEIRGLGREWELRGEMGGAFGGGEWVEGLVELVEKRMGIESVDGQEAAGVLDEARKGIEATEKRVMDGEVKVGREVAFKAFEQLGQLGERLGEWYGFYEGYHPLFTWWVRRPWRELETKLQAFRNLVREKVVGLEPGSEDAIVGQPIGRSAINEELEAEMIPYTPEELLQIAEKEYAWCEAEAIKASQSMGYGDDWRAAQETIKNMYSPPGGQPSMVRSLADEAITYVENHDLVTIPTLAKECWRTFMISPPRQKANPFFLGGETMQISYPTSTMRHEDKLTIMRGNNKPFSRSTVFHELLPGHHLQTHWMSRSNTHRRLFETPFWIEGWAFYWEMILWNRGYPETPEDKLGMLFWRMHRCARIIFSLNFHLGKWTPQRCIECLVEKVGFEPANAEGEVRRSFNGDYGALYQVGYMIGALQMYALRKEVVENEGRYGEKEFHDRVLRESCMPIEMLRALLKGEELSVDYKAKWRFYDL